LLTDRLASWLAALRPAPLTVDHRERWRAAFGGFIGILITGVLCRWADGAWLSGTSLPWLVAPLGASAVLVFCVPGSPLAQGALGRGGRQHAVGPGGHHLRQPDP